MALYPFILVKYRRDLTNPILLNHERIHHRQQLELLIVPFYLWYLGDYLFNLIKYRNHSQAYRQISFEKEAYAWEEDLSYLSKRRWWAFLRYYETE